MAGALIGLLVVACFLISVYRAWDLVGSPSFDLGREVRSAFAKRR